MEKMHRLCSFDSAGRLFCRTLCSVRIFPTLSDSHCRTSCSQDRAKAGVPPGRRGARARPGGLFTLPWHIPELPRTCRAAVFWETSKLLSGTKQSGAECDLMFPTHQRSTTTFQDAVSVDVSGGRRPLTHELQSGDRFRGSIGIGDYGMRAAATAGRGGCSDSRSTWTAPGGWVLVPQGTMSREKKVSAGPDPLAHCRGRPKIRRSSLVCVPSVFR